MIDRRSYKFLIAASIKMKKK